MHINGFDIKNSNIYIFYNEYYCIFDHVLIRFVCSNIKL
jgi:hypothetical protein